MNRNDDIGLELLAEALRSLREGLSGLPPTDGGLDEAAAEVDLHLALAEFPQEMCEGAQAVAEWDRPHLTCLRACVMKPEHQKWMPEIVSRLQQVASSIDP